MVPSRYLNAPPIYVKCTEKLRRSILILIRAPSWPEGKWLFRNDRLREMSLLLASSIAIITVARRRLSLALMNRITLLPRRSSYVCNCTKETKASKSHRWLWIMRRWLWCNKRFCFEENLESKVQANMVFENVWIFNSPFVPNHNNWYQETEFSVPDFETNLNVTLI